MFVWTLQDVLTVIGLCLMAAVIFWESYRDYRKEKEKNARKRKWKD